MAQVKTQMAAIGNEPEACTRKFIRGETMYAVEYNDGAPAGWHNTECICFWKVNGEAKCAEREADNAD